MSKFIIIVFVIAHIIFSEVNSSEEKVLWGERNIEWKDFKGSPPIGYNTSHGAYTTSSIEVQYSGFEGKIPKTKVCCYFLKNKSWTLLSDDYSLNHERLHFDIGEIYARKIRKAFDSLQSENVTNISKYNDIVKMYDNQQEKYNYKYDGDVYGDKERIAFWNKKIKSELAELEEYEYVP